jgi:hypothetical protein
VLTKARKKDIVGMEPPYSKHLLMLLEPVTQKVINLLLLLDPLLLIRKTADLLP